VMGRGRALEVLLSADDIRGADAELLGYVNRALPDAELDYFVDALATRIASFDKWAIANTKRLVNEAILPQGLQKPGDSENRLGFYVGQPGLGGGPATEPERALSQFRRSSLSLGRGRLLACSGALRPGLDNLAPVQARRALKARSANCPVDDPLTDKERKSDGQAS